MKHRIVACTTVLVVCGVQPALAENADGYASISVGASRAGVDCSDASRCDRSGTSGRIVLGWRVGTNVAIEATYAELGRASADASFDGTTASADARSRSIGAGLAVLYPFGSTQEWTAIGRVGVASNRTRVSVSGGGDPDSDSQSHTAPYFGLALEYALTPSLDAGIAWDYTKIKFAGESAGVHSLGVVLGLRF